MAVRADLLELGADALAALANVGFVKRAQKDLAAGRAPTLTTLDDGTVEARFAEDGIITRLPSGRTLRDADCNCSASGMCRHRVMLVLAYQARFGAEGAEGGERWTPAEFDDAALAASLSPSVLAQAFELARAHPVIGVELPAGAPPAARLPMASVVFYARHALAHARCDCAQGGGCVHVALAVWAFRQAEDILGADVRRATVEVRPPQTHTQTHTQTRTQTEALTRSESARALITRVDALLHGLWLEGAAQPLLALDARLQAARADAQTLGWHWVDDALDELEQLLHALHARGSRFDPLRLIGVVAELWARLAAACRFDQSEAPRLPARHVLGVGVKGETPLDRLRLVSLGANLWADEAGTDAAAEGADLLFADPDTQTVMVLQRQWPRTAGAVPSARTRRVAGVPLHQLAAGQVLTASASRRANGVLEIGGTARKTGVLPLSPAAWDALSEPLRQRSIAALTHHLTAQSPEFTRPRHVAGMVNVLAPGVLTLLDWRWDAAAQVLHASLQDDEAYPVMRLALPHRAAAPHAVDALARALAGEWGALRAVAGPVRLLAGEAQMLPLALITEQRAIVPQTEAPPPQAQTLPQGSNAPPQGYRARVDATLQWLAHLLRQGLRHQAGDLTRQFREQSERLAGAGLTQSAQSLRAVDENWRAGRDHLPGLLASVILHLQEMARGG
ncbi:hypothetical protein FACS1894116_11100 [Betaproteobacteria bacterium]|nr:hypothetical protein FACS1894116_11100 [Betaproteobacteria bacterium]GHU23984.1 hypothetical protein FACS189488_07680 [Betaproteobacteria bacterium]GHU28831.1 hypothetical protein FACS189497_05300 [Betaproteobacteria bacterium]